MLLKSLFREIYNNSDVTCLLKTVCDIRDGTHDSPKYVSNGFPLVTSKNLTSGFIDLSNVNLISDSDFKNINKRSKVAKNDILMPMIGTIGKPVIIDTEPNFAIKNVALLRTSASNQLSPSYLKAFLESFAFEEQKKLLSRGGTQKFISLNNIRELKIKIPSIKTQQSFSVIAQQVKKTKATLKAMLEKISLLKKAKFKEMFGDQENNPYHFIQMKIEDCCNLKNGESLKASVENEGGPIPYVKVGDMNLKGNESYITTSSRYVSIETAGKGLIPKNSVIFPKNGGAIFTNKKRLSVLPICIDLNTMAVTPNQNVLPEYLYIFFEGIDLSRFCYGSAVPQLSKKDIGSINILVPPIELQKQFVSFVKHLNKTKATLERALEDLS